MKYGLIPSTSNVPACLPTEVTAQCDEDLIDEATIKKKMESCNQKKDCMLRFTKGEPAFLKKPLGK